jgi:uncharacterized protein YktB (UPF0637 family)
VLENSIRREHLNLYRTINQLDSSVYKEHSKFNEMGLMNSNSYAYYKYINEKRKQSKDLKNLEKQLCLVEQNNTQSVDTLLTNEEKDLNKSSNKLNVSSVLENSIQREHWNMLRTINNLRSAGYKERSKSSK